uniref:Cox19 family protein (CHCH motif) n=2 Tax=Zea mays TaxID=4577 RepID=A0A804M8R1_MAIZE
MQKGYLSALQKDDGQSKARKGGRTELAKKRTRGTMATAQAASASPTHHRASPGMSPPQPPYPSAARIADSACFPQYTASLKCLEANQDKTKCQQQFDDYKECKKKEREARLERNKTRSLFG